MNKDDGENKKRGGANDKKEGDELKGGREDNTGEGKNTEVHIHRYAIEYVLSRPYQSHSNQISRYGIIISHESTLGGI